MSLRPWQGDRIHFAWGAALCGERVASQRAFKTDFCRPGIRNQGCREAETRKHWWWILALPHPLPADLRHQHRLCDSGQRTRPGAQPERAHRPSQYSLLDIRPQRFKGISNRGHGYGRGTEAHLQHHTLLPGPHFDLHTLTQIAGEHSAISRSSIATFTIFVRYKWNHEKAN